MIASFFKKSLLKLLLFTFVLVLLTAPIAWLQFNHPQRLYSITSIITHFPTIFTVFRYLLIALFVSGWPHFIGYCSRKNNWSLAKTQFWLTQRVRLSTWLIIIELFICESWLLTIIKAL